jgi:hypothetical protein
VQIVDLRSALFRNGRMFPIIESFTGNRIDRAYADGRTRWEPLY